MRSPKTKLPVLIRAEGKRRPAPAALRDLLAVFPTESGSTSDPYLMSCFSPSEGHSSCAPDYLREKTRPATPSETKTMLAALRRAGYKDLRVVRRMTHAYQRARTTAQRRGA